MDTTPFEMQEIFKAYLTFSTDTGLAGLGPDDMDQPSDGEGNLMGAKFGPNSFGWTHYANAEQNDTAATPGSGSANLAYNSDNKFYYVDSTTAIHLLATEAYVTAAIAAITYGPFTDTGILFADSTSSFTTDAALRYEAANDKLVLGTGSAVGEFTILKSNTAGGVGYYVKNTGVNALSDSYFLAINQSGSQSVALVAKNAASGENSYVGTTTNTTLGLRVNNIEFVRLIPGGQMEITDSGDVLLNIQSTHATLSSVGITVRSKAASVDVVSQFYNVDDTLNIGTTSPHDVIIGSNSQDYLHIATDGNIGIGDATPGMKLSVKDATLARVNIEGISTTDSLGALYVTGWDTAVFSTFKIEAGGDDLVIGSVSNTRLDVCVNNTNQAYFNTNGSFEVLNNGIKTQQPTANGAGLWKLGKVKAGSPIGFDGTKTIEIDDDGVIYQLLIATF